MSVIVGRALPDVRDGLKPVHRRILFAMHGLSLSPSTPHRKCARVVGEVLGKYHPHGDTAVYDALVRLAQPFSMRSPLVDGHGNFGSLDADPPAAMRYTECRLRALSAEVLLKDLSAEGTVRMAPNFDGSVDEPTVLPARVPLLLVNGSSGIAVGIATRIPPHNLREVVAAMTLLVKNPDASTAELMRLLPAPDFPTGGEILDAGGVASAYESGRGPVTVRGKVDIEVDGDGGKKAKKVSRRGRKGAAAVAPAASLSSADSDTETVASSALSALDDASLDGASGKTRIVISELPYQTNKAAFVQRVAELVDEGVLTGIADVRDESDRSGTRVVVELRRGVSARVVLGSLYKQTPLQVRGKRKRF
jgi:DNA gyrase subunit A